MNDIKAEYRKERVLLEQKYMALYQPVYDKRVPVISGDVAVTLTEEEESAIPDEALESKDGEKGILGFWLQALGQNEDVSQFITEEDIPLMEKIKDITVNYNEDYTSFTLTFFFEANEYMEQTELSKKYTVTPDLLDEEAPSLTGNEGTEISWKAGKDLTVTEVKKKQKAKGGKEQGPDSDNHQVGAQTLFFSGISRILVRMMMMRRRKIWMMANIWASLA